MIEDLGNVPITNERLQFLVKTFRATFGLPQAFTDDQAEVNVRKISLEPGIGYLNIDGGKFSEDARGAIYQYSEIDLEHSETEEILESLVTLVEKKSFKHILSVVNAAELDEKAGVGIDDLLEILSISKGAYFSLLKGGDSKALKSASIIQRKLTEAGASNEMIEYCSQQKVNWDIWIREKRHFATAFDLNHLLAKLATIQKDWSKFGGGIEGLHQKIADLYMTEQSSALGKSLTKDLLLGGVFSLIVRSEAK